MSLSLFFGNLPTSITEDDLHALCTTYGRVVEVRLPRERDTGKPKQFGFVDMSDPQAVAAAVKALNGYELKGQALRVDAAGTAPRSAGSGGGGGGGGRECGARDRGRRPGGGREQRGGATAHAPSMHSLMMHAEADPVAMSEQINALSPEQLWDIVHQMKLLVDADADQARRTLACSRAAGLAILKAQMRLGMVTVESISAVMAAMLQQVLALTPEQLAALPPEQRAQIEMLRQQLQQY